MSGSLIISPVLSMGFIFKQYSFCKTFRNGLLSRKKLIEWQGKQHNIHIVWSCIIAYICSINSKKDSRKILYNSDMENIFQQFFSLRDLGVKHSNKGNFEGLINKVSKAVRKKIGWRIRTFKYKPSTNSINMRCIQGKKGNLVLVISHSRQMNI